MTSSINPKIYLVTNKVWRINLMCFDFSWQFPQINDEYPFIIDSCTFDGFSQMIQVLYLISLIINVTSVIESQSK